MGTASSIRMRPIGRALARRTTQRGRAFGLGLIKSPCELNDRLRIARSAQYNFNWKSLSVAAGITLWNFYDGDGRRVAKLIVGAIKFPLRFWEIDAATRHL